jgi:hypothetical protein
LVKAENAAAELKSGEVLLENTCFIVKEEMLVSQNN